METTGPIVALYNDGSSALTVNVCSWNSCGIYTLTDGKEVFLTSINFLMFPHQKVYLNGRKYKIDKIDTRRNEIVLRHNNSTLTVNELLSVTRRPVHPKSAYQVNHVYIVENGAVQSSYKFRGRPNLKRIIREAESEIFWSHIVLTTKNKWHADDEIDIIIADASGHWGVWNTVDNGMIKNILDLLQY